MIAAHQSLKYLDISQNCLRNKAFIKLFAAVQSEDSKINTFHCRKNMIGGPRLDSVLNFRSRHLSVLNLSQNKLTENNSEILLQCANENVFIE